MSFLGLGVPPPAASWGIDAQPMRARFYSTRRIWSSSGDRGDAVRASFNFLGRRAARLPRSADEDRSRTVIGKPPFRW